MAISWAAQLHGLVRYDFRTKHTKITILIFQDPEDDEAPIRPDLFIENFGKGFKEGISPKDGGADENVIDIYSFNSHLTS